jgi:GNAT superfamily N-acetyltransferase
MADKYRDVRTFVVETNDGRLAGIVSLDQFDETSWEVAAVGVSVDFQRCGVARALVKFAVANTIEAQDDVVLFLVHEGNAPMQQLAREFQAQPTADPDMDGYDYWLAESRIITKNVHVAMARAQQAVDKRREPAGLGLGLRG